MLDNDIISRVDKVFREAFEEYCDKHAVSTAAFWKLKIPERIEYDQKELEGAVAASLLNKNFSARHVSGLLLYVSRQVEGPAHNLWAEILIPSLAGQGDGKKQKTELIKEAFQSDRPVRSVLRSWLAKYKRTRFYFPPPHHWFVRAVIGECNLLALSGDFMSVFFKEMFKRGSLGEISSEEAGNLFSDLKERHSPDKKNAGDSGRSIDALREFLLEAGQTVAAIARFIRNRIPPEGGWSVDGVIKNVRKHLDLDPQSLPRVALEELRNRIGEGISTFTFAQILGIFRNNPDAEIRVPGVSWTPDGVEALPVGRAELVMPGAPARPVDLVDDLGRDSTELIGVLEKGDRGWHEAEGQRIVWRVSREEFTGDHPNRLRRMARPIIRPGGRVEEPSGWVWAGPPAWQRSPGDRSGSTSGKLAVPQSASGRRLRLVVKSHQRVDDDGSATFFVSRFLVPNAPGYGRLKLVCGVAGGREIELWEGASTHAWINLRMNVPARPGLSTVFRVELVTSSEESDYESGERRCPWAMPALFCSGRLLRPCRQTIPEENRLCLISEDSPQVKNGKVEELEAEESNDSFFRRFEIQLDATNENASIRSSGQSWVFTAEARPVPVLRLEAAGTQAVDSREFELSADQDLLFFFGQHPKVCISVNQSGLVELAEDEARALLGDSRLCMGLDDDLSPTHTPLLRELQTEITIVPRPGRGVDFIADLADVLPVNMLEAGFDVHRVCIDHWDEDEPAESEGAERGVTGRRYVVLPYDSEELKPRTASFRGGLLLRDVSSAYEELILYAPEESTIPLADVLDIRSTVFSAAYPFTEMNLLSQRTLPLRGPWVYIDPVITWEELNTLLNEKKKVCRYINPGGLQLESILIVQDEEGEKHQRERQISFTGNKDFRLEDLLPGAAWPQKDKAFHDRWKLSEKSELILRYDGEDVERLEFDFRVAVRSFEVEVQGPTPAHQTAVAVTVSVVPGSQSDRSLVLDVFSRARDDVVASVMMEFHSEQAGLIEKTVEVKLPEPGEYELRLKRKSDGELLASRPVRARKFTAEEVVSLDDIMAGWPEGEPAVEAVFDLYEAVSRELAPWENKHLIYMLDATLERIRIRDSFKYRLVDTLHAFLEKRELPQAIIVNPSELPREQLWCVSGAALQVQFNTPKPSRRDLPQWQECLAEAADSLAEGQSRSWLRLLSAAASALQAGGGGFADGEKKSGNIESLFPCRIEFTDFLASLS